MLSLLLIPIEKNILPDGSNSFDSSCAQFVTCNFDTKKESVNPSASDVCDVKVRGNTEKTAMNSAKALGCIVNSNTIIFWNHLLFKIAMRRIETNICYANEGFSSQVEV